MEPRICITGIYYSGNHEQFRNPRVPTTVAELGSSWTPVASHSIYPGANQDQEGILEKFFTYFNWQHSENGEFGYAGEGVNGCCKYAGCHASMSVGDVLMLVSDTGIEYYFVEPFGWKKLELK